ncbi:Dolichyl-phosphate-mannose-protein mannosyltransferase [Singulisphaera sp. GP187]|uniref:ArnT family glycosyltransferase n=1 Tax=Singulisphaera sp. GP187 TaxID=1882752 RepID=UPI000927A583|nr:glycosyltransferase family 39 protein [Singulisphaera sp. GP187]SIO60009.1 Dolichyl-phosphate-mannose-protein mannosyltransferase [Singulisphaera sp. GP187]
MWFSRESLAVVGVLLLTVGIRAIKLDQPIVENYVGRQIPTAMVARNLARGSGFLRPQLDTAPLPNLFLVEPPLYALAAASLQRRTGLPLEASGRLVSALAIALGGWGLHGLAKRRLGGRPALLALAAFVIFPVTVRYGRSFQPDALMIGLLVAGMRCWDDYEAGGRLFWLGLGVVLIATGLAIKIVAASILIPLVTVILRPRWSWKIALVVSLMVPALLWYWHAASLLSAGAGSRASADNGAIWLRVLIPTALFRPETAVHVARFLLRSFTPFGLALALLGLRPPRAGDRLWTVWGASTLAALAALAGKLHHEYYWLMFAPVMAVGVGKGLDHLIVRRRAFGEIAGAGLLGLALIQSWSTWKTPVEWSSLAEAARAIQANVPQAAWVAAPEALLFASDRRGCRMEFTASAAKRAAGEWGDVLDSEGPLALVEFYRIQGARYVADVSTDDPNRLALHEAIRRRYKVLVDRPGILLAVLIDPQDELDGTR